MSERSKGACDKPTSMPQNKAYDDGYDRIFKKHKEELVKAAAQNVISAINKQLEEACEFIRVKGSDWECQKCGKKNPNDCPHRQ